LPLGAPEATLYIWKAKYGGLEVCEAKRLLTDAMLDNSGLTQSRRSKTIAACRWLHASRDYIL
jgi:hypothetical protein